MTPERWQQVREVFDRAVALPSEERTAYLGAACANDADLRNEVESLLFSDGAGGSWISEYSSGGLIAGRGRCRA